MGQIAVSAKEAYPDAGWNLARWLQALRRGQGVRPSWFSGQDGDTLSVGPGAGNVGARAGLPTAKETTVAPPAQQVYQPAPLPGSLTGVAVVAGGPGARHGAAANGGGATTDLEEDLFGNLDDL